MIKKVYWILAVFSWMGIFPVQGVEGGAMDMRANFMVAATPKPAPRCDVSVITICTVEIWLAHKHKKKNKEIRGFLKSKSIKVLRHSIQYWKPRGGHPPTNIAIGNGLSARDARLIIDFALKYNDRIEFLVVQLLNPSNYVAIATSAWDEKKLIPITEKDLKRLRNPKLSTEEFHALYRELTGEKNFPDGFF